MLKILKKIFNSGIFRLILSVVLIYFAFRKVDILMLLEDMKSLSFGFVVVNVLVAFLIVLVISLRWTLLLFPKINLKTVLNFTRANFLASFYSLFFSTSVVGDISKWLVIDGEYPDIPKDKVLASVMLDRFIGASVFCLLGLISVVVGKEMGLAIPPFAFWLFLTFIIFCVIIYAVIIVSDINKLLPKAKWLHRFDGAFELFKSGNRRQIIKCFLISIVSELVWILQIWYVGLNFGASLELLSVFIFAPVVSMILILPISVGGFGAREQLYLFFFSQGGASNESILLMSTFLGTLGIINSLLGGFLLIFKGKKKVSVNGRISS